MTQKIKKYKINTSQLINFFDNLPDDNRFYKSHPSNADRVIQLKKEEDFLGFQKLVLIFY